MLCQAQSVGLLLHVVRQVLLYHNHEELKMDTDSVYFALLGNIHAFVVNQIREKFVKN